MRVAGPCRREVLATVKLSAKGGERSCRGGEAIELRLAGEGLVLPPCESIPDHAAGRPDRLVQPFLEQRCGLAKYLVETTQERPAKIFAIADDQFFRLSEHALAQPPPAQRCRKQVIHQPARVGNERRDSRGDCRSANTDPRRVRSSCSICAPSGTSNISAAVRRTRSTSAFTRSWQPRIAAAANAFTNGSRAASNSLCMAVDKARRVASSPALGTVPERVASITSVSFSAISWRRRIGLLGDETK